MSDLRLAVANVEFLIARPYRELAENVATRGAHGAERMADRRLHAPRLERIDREHAPWRPASFRHPLYLNTESLPRIGESICNCVLPICEKLFLGI